MIRPCRLLLSALLALLATASVHAGEVTIYRCTDAKGQLALRDTPCRAGEKQEARTMVRPTDPPPRAIPAPAPAAKESYGPAPRYVVVTPPQPLYECITPDGERYTSDTSEGHVRWEESWMFGYPALPRRGGGGGVSATMDARSGNVSGSVRIGDSNHFRRPVLVPAIPYGQYLYDECNRLPQAEVCGRLRDERHELNRRWNIAQPSERADIDRETRGIDARLANDCGES
ncbi:hypothetical protein J2X04_002317 [Lysobacter niabensis]|uniref:DUF4124 domain-containing protein n=1 Tax=Agrilutibacter niabensis TaxID=380628 RepID=A0ABU1VR17_9GAMM|nr:DUF4124 domain-containing protein [Lysobacter niabensis]MDR7099936.1 hypothetical protein [Lysobacter niabensis]